MILQMRALSVLAGRRLPTMPVCRHPAKIPWRYACNMHTSSGESVAERVVSSIVQSMEAHSRDETRTLAILCDNESGVLSRVAGTLSARGFNIHSLTVSPTNIPDLSRMTIVMKDVPDFKLSQALKQLSDIVNVWAVLDYTNTNSLSREIVMMKVAYMPKHVVHTLDAKKDLDEDYEDILRSQSHRAALRDVAALFGAEVVDVGTQHITYQLTSWSRRIDAFITMMQPFGIIEVARSGVITMLRSPVSGTTDNPLVLPQERLHHREHRAHDPAAIDEPALPPG